MSRIPTFPLLLATAALGLPACAFDDGGTDEGRPLAAQLDTRVYLDLAPSSHVGVSAYDADGNHLDYVEPVVAGGQVILRSSGDGWLLVEDLEIQLEDVTIPAGELADQPIYVTDIELRLGTQIAAQPFWAGDGRAVWGTGDADLLLDWSWLLPNGDVYPLATQKLGAAEFTLAVTLDDYDTMSAEVATAMPGEVHELTGLVTFKDLSIAVDAVRASVD
jgi:hypothetical protein